MLSLVQLSLAVILKPLLLLELHQKQFLLLWKCLSQCKGCGQSCEYAYLHLHSPPHAYSQKTSLSCSLDETHTSSDIFNCVQQPLGIFMNTANPENLYWAISGRWKKNSDFQKSNKILSTFCMCCRLDWWHHLLKLPRSSIIKYFFCCLWLCQNLSWNFAYWVSASGWIFLEKSSQITISKNKIRGKYIILSVSNILVTCFAWNFNYLKKKCNIWQGWLRYPACALCRWHGTALWTN